MRSQLSGKAPTVDDRLSSIRRLHDQQPTAEIADELRVALHNKSNLIVAAGAAIVGDQNLAEMQSDLKAAFERFLVDPVKNDKLCRAKVAVIQSLDKLGYEQADLYLRAASHVQLEPVGAGRKTRLRPRASLSSRSQD